LVLAARSEYFAAMFGPDFKESKEKIIEIKEDEELFKQMIEIFYTNNVSEVDFDVALELIVLARKYLVEELDKSCEEIIIKNMTVENCLEILLVTDSIQSKLFKDRAIGFISANIKSVMKAPGWEALKANKPNLVIEVTTKMLE
jgi:speckle-type POZ protein